MPAANQPNITTYATPTDHEVVITRVVHAPRELVFAAWTDPKYVPRWMVGPEGWTMPVCEIDLRSGGTWHFVWRRANGTEMGMSGTYKEVSPPERVVTTEKWGPEWPETINTLVLTEQDGATLMTLTILYPSKEARDAALETGMKDGTEQSYERLAEFLKTLT